MPHDEIEKPAPGCTPEYCAKPSLETNIQLNSAEEEIRIIKKVIEEEHFFSPATLPDKS